MEWPEDYEDPEETFESMKRLGKAIIEGTAHRGNGEWLERLADALLVANHGPDFCGRGYCQVCLDRLHHDDRPHGEMQPIIDRMEAGDPDEERYEAWLDAEDAHLEAAYEDRYEED